MIDYSIEFINNPAKLVNLVERLTAVSVFAVDIETVDWWNRHQERIALIQIAFRTERGVKVSVIDALSEIDLQTLRIPLESNSTTKIIHNAAFDATRLFNHYKFKVAPIHDTMLAARRNREKKCSLQTQAATHLNLHLDKRAQRSNWSRRPLDLKQIDYAAQDAYAALRLYELQTERNLDGLYRQKAPSSSIQEPLPLNNSLESVNATPNPDVLERQTDSLQANNASTFDLSTSSTAVLGIVSELPTRYGTEQLSVSVGKDRVGLAGWIIDCMIGKEADFDEGTARLVIADLLDRKLIKLTETQRLEATPKGINMWNQLKTTS